jgi:hypothetical protein
MTRARLAGALLLLLPVLAACGGHRATKTERRIKTYIERTQPYYEVLKEAPADAKVEALHCRTITGTETLACDMTLRGSKTERWGVYKAPHGKFYFARCKDSYPGDERGYNPERDPCVVDISN